MSDVTVETAQALLASMDTEEPFRLLRTLPGKLEELWATEGQSASAERRLAEEISLSQSKACDYIHSASSRVPEWNDEVRSSLDAHVRHLQREADGLQESLEHLQLNHRPNALPRRHRAKANSFKDLNDELSRLQDMTAQIRDIARCVADAATGLVREEASFDALTHKTLREFGLDLNGDDAWATPPDPPDAEEVHSSVQMLVENMEKRCEDLETYITFNKDVLNKQTQQIGRLRRTLNTSWGPARGASEGQGPKERHLDLVPCFALAAATMSVALVILVVLR